MNSPTGVPSQRQPVASSQGGNTVHPIKLCSSKPVAGSRNVGRPWAWGYTDSSRLCGLGTAPTRRASCCPATPPLRRVVCRLPRLWCLTRGQCQRLRRRGPCRNVIAQAGTVLHAWRAAMSSSTTPQDPRAPGSARYRSRVQGQLSLLGVRPEETTTGALAPALGQSLGETGRRAP